MPNAPVSGSHLSISERREMLEKLASHLISAAEQANREGDSAASTDLKEVAYVLLSQMDRIAADHGKRATDIVAEAVRLLAKAYDGRDAGWFLLH